MKKDFLEISAAMPYDIKYTMKMPKDFTIVLANSTKNSPIPVNLSILKSSSILIAQYEAANPESKSYVIEDSKLLDEDINLFLWFSYGNKIKINYQMHDSIKKIATYFNSPLLLEKSFAFEKYVKSIETVMRMLRDQNKCEKYLNLIAKHFYVFRISQYLSKCDLTLIYRILLMPNLCDNSEESICLFLMEYLSQLKDNQPILVDVKKLLCSIRSELFSDSFCQYLIKNFESKKKYLFHLIKRRLTYEKENDSLPSRVYQKNDIETCMEQFFQDYSSIT